MKKVLSIIILFLMCSMVFAYSPMLTTTNQYYSVQFDGEGEATVTLNLQLTNSDSEPIDSLVIEIPGEDVQVLGVVQSVSGSNCLSWDEQCTQYGEGETCIRYNYNGDCAEYQRPCLKRERVCTRYDYYNTRYEKIDVDPLRLSESVSIPIDLLDEVNQQESTTLIVLYKSESYSRNKLGLRQFDFETAKTAYHSNNVRVAVNVDPGLHLKGSSATVNYRSNQLPSLMAGSVDQAKSEMINNYARQITYMSGYVKQASNLDPYESFSVKGKYSQSRLRLYLGRTVLIALFFIGMIILGVYGIKKLSGFAKAKKEHTFMIPFLSGLFTAIGLTLLWIVTIVLINLLNDVLHYSVVNLFGIVLVLLSVLITLAVLGGVPIYMGSKFEPETGVFTLASMLGWLFVFVIVCFVTVGLFGARVF